MDEELKKKIGAFKVGGGDLTVHRGNKEEGVLIWTMKSVPIVVARHLQPGDEVDQVIEKLIDLTTLYEGDLTQRLVKLFKEHPWDEPVTPVS